MIHDITRPLLNGMPVFPGDTKPVFSVLDSGDYRITEISICSHTGTHIDAPAHYFKNGASIDTIALSKIIGPCRVLDTGECEKSLEPQDLGTLHPDDKRLIIRTGYTGNTFDPSYTGLSPKAAEYLVRSGICCLGTDTPSIEPFHGDGTVHRKLLQAGIPIIENLDLSQVPAGVYYLLALPLLLTGGDGSPCRAVLMDPGINGEIECIL